MSQFSSPPDRLVLALAQINCVVGAIDANLEKARAAREKANKLGADLVMFSELFLAGYPPEDLVLKPAFQFPAAPRWKIWRARLPMVGLPC